MTIDAMKLLFTINLISCTILNLNAQFFGRVYFEPFEYVLKKNDIVDVNLTNYEHRYNYASGSTIGLSCLKRNNKNESWSYGVNVEFNNYISRFSLEYVRFFPNERLVEIVHYFRFSEMRPQLVLMHATQKFEFILKFGHWFSVNKNNGPEYFYLYNSVSTPTDSRKQSFEERFFNRKYGRGIIDFSFNTILSKKSRLGVNVGVHYSNRIEEKSAPIYSIEIKNNLHNTSNSFRKDVIDIRIQKHTLDAGLVYTFVF